jgi:hypothetical protein
MVITSCWSVLPQGLHWQGIDDDANAVADGAALPYFGSHEMMML